MLQQLDNYEDLQNARQCDDTNLLQKSESKERKFVRLEDIEEEERVKNPCHYLVVNCIEFNFFAEEIGRFHYLIETNKSFSTYRNVTF